MVSKKKRSQTSEGTSETMGKKIKLSEDVNTDTAMSTLVEGTSYKTLKDAKNLQTSLIKTEDEDDNVQTHHTKENNCDIPDWPEAHLMELMKRMEKEIPPKDNLRFDSRSEKLKWENIGFMDYSPDQCKEMWGKIQKRLRRFRLLREVLEDAKAWVSKPWTHFYRGPKLNRHPDLPRRPLSTYMLFYLEKKDRVAKEHPGLEMTSVSKHIAEMYKCLPEKKKQKYIDMAAAQRKEYELKLEEFNREHPDLITKIMPSKEHKSGATEEGPRKPTTPFKLFYADQESRHKNDQNFDKQELLEKCREQWKNMSDKKKVVWINWAVEEEIKYQEELKAYMSENPNFVPTTLKAILTKEEKSLRERVAGKPEKPPNSGYSLFSRIMLVSAEIKQVAPKERMSQISKLWRGMTDVEKKKYQEQVNHMLDQYKLEYATYLESLSEDKRQEELQNNQPKRKANKGKDKATKTVTKTKVPKKKENESEEKSLYEGEPESPPVNAYQLFLKAFMTEATYLDPKYREKEAPRHWQMLPETERAKYHKKTEELKHKYIKDYEKFLKSLSQDQLKDYSLQKSSKKEKQDSSEESESDDDSDEDSKDGDSDNQEGSDSDDSSSDNDSDSNGTSDSSDSEGNNNENKNSAESSSSDSDSD